MEFKELLDDAWIHPKEAAAMLGVTRNTIYKYRRDGAPPLIIMALKHQLGKIKGWDGYQIKGDHLITKSGEKLHKNLLDAYDYWTYLQRLRGWEGKNRPRPPKTENNVVVHPKAIESELKKYKKR